MKILYINDELITGDGSNTHAIGMLNAFKEILGDDNVMSYPEPEDGSKKQVNINANKLKNKFKILLSIIRFFRKKYLSKKKSKLICEKLYKKKFYPTHVIARATSFDVTAIYVAKKLKAKLIYEINTPMFFECGKLNKEPLIRSIEKWEKRIISASDYIYIVSNVCKNMICEHYNITQEKFIVVPNGFIDGLYWENDKKRLDVRNQVRMDENLEDKFIILFIGSLKIWHGIEKLCNVALAMEKYEDIIFLVLGDGDMHDDVVEYCTNHSNMMFKGKVELEIMKKYLYASDIGIMPYDKNKNFYYSPLKMYDMIGAGLPFIGTRVGQIEEICEEQLGSDLLVDDTSLETLVKKIQYEKEFHRKRIDTDIRKNYSWRKRANQLLSEINRRSIGENIS